MTDPGATHLDDLLNRLASMPPDEKQELILKAKPVLAAMKFIPNPGPQTDLFLTTADITLYGGQGGGGKTAGIIGLALTQHESSLIMRRRYTDLGSVLDDAARFNGTDDGFKRSSPPRLRTNDKRIIDFGAAKKIGDEQQWQGHPHDLIGLDEATQFAERQVRFLMGWNRSINPKQRCRVVLGTNPPLNREGEWIIQFFAPWLKRGHPNPAKPGELRWFVTDPDGHDLEVPDATPVTLLDGNGKSRVYRPLSRTFIPASLQDNPFLRDTNYQSVLDSLPEPLRSAIRDGNFMLDRKDALNQIIPMAWIRAAQERWTPKPPDGVPQCAIATDVAQGGEDNTTIQWRHDGWFSEIVEEPGVDTPDGSAVAGLVIQYRRDGSTVIVDMGGGYGGGTWLRLKDNQIDPMFAYKGSESANARTKDKKLSFTNTRTMAYWRMREALDPDQDGGSPIALPPDDILAADLAAVTFEVTASGIKAETKEDVVDKLNRSPDRGDVCVMLWSDGAKTSTHGNLQRPSGQRSRPKVILGHQNRRR